VLSLKEEISGFKRQREPQQKQYVKRGELEDRKKIQRLEEFAVEEKKQKEKEEEKLKEILETYKVPVKEETKVEEVVLPREEVIRRLKARNLPITLFGEDDVARAERLRQLELKVPMEYIQAGEFEGSDFLKAMENAEVDEEEDIEVQKKKKAEEDDPDFKIENRQPTGTEEEILFFFREIVRDMGLQLDSRTAAEKNTALGRRGSAQYQQTKAFVRPFFRMCRKKAVPKDILKEMANIVKALKSKNYVKANDAYYRMAIGNSPWPMGVTMVGIHERSAREKISTSDQAHILNDETQRKYIQAVKRMMTFTQQQNPVNPSMSVM